MRTTGAGSAPVAAGVRAAWVDRQARKGTGPERPRRRYVDLERRRRTGDMGPVVPPPVGRPPQEPAR